MTNHPKVSVCITTYNRAHYLPQCLDSILAQSYQDFEIVIVDDGSTDCSDQVLTDYQQRFPEKIFHFWHDGHINKGISASTNLAFAKSGGDYLALIGSDDVWLPDMLAQQVAQLDANPGFGLVYSHAHYIDEDGNRLPGILGKDITTDTDPAMQMILTNPIPALTVVLRRACLDDIGVFDENLIYGDWDLEVRVLAHWEAGFVDKPLALYRLHKYNTSTGIDPLLDYRRILDLLLALREKSPNIGGRLGRPRNLALLELQIAYFLYRCGKREEAALNLHLAFEKDPSLRGDAEFLDDWSNTAKAGCTDTRSAHFGFWALAQLPATLGGAMCKELIDRQLRRRETADFFIRRGVEDGLSHANPIGMDGVFDDWPRIVPLPRSWKNYVLGNIYRTLLFESYKLRQMRKLRYYWLRSIQYHPSSLLNRGVLSIGLQSFLSLKSVTG